MKRFSLIILLLLCTLFSSCSQMQTETKTEWQIEKRPIRMFMADGSLYFDSGTISTIEARCGTLDGNLKKTVSEIEIPKKDGECNFEGASGYQLTTNITKEVPMENEWVVFKKFDQDDININEFKYCYYLKGRLPNAKADSEIVLLSENKNITFDDVFKLLLSSHHNPDEKKIKFKFVMYSVSDEWGINVNIKEANNKKATLIVEQFGKETDGELVCGDYFLLEKNENDKWKPLEHKSTFIAHSDKAYIIKPNSKTELNINFEWLYGKLPKGTYRIKKEIMNFRKTGDYDTKEYNAVFEIK